ncbi:MAG: DUF3078 domain-containing protein [Muribaculaceae bacterium]|nr:DUF3078 domain-containing protein [Muribaculaceae bacterium]
MNEIPTATAGLLLGSMALLATVPQIAAQTSDEYLLLNPELEQNDTIAYDPARVRDVDEILSSLPPAEVKGPQRPNPLFGPIVFSGYRPLNQKHFQVPELEREFYDEVVYRMAVDRATALTDSIAVLDILDVEAEDIAEVPDIAPPISRPQVVKPNLIPDWLRSSMRMARIQDDFVYSLMIDDYKIIDYADWDLPIPPRLPEDDTSFDAYIRRLDLPEVDNSKAQLKAAEIEKKHWLHIFNTGLQFSQAYLSSNWYQGGNNNLSLFFNFLWDVSLNPVWHPKLLFQSTLSYKLGLAGAPQDTEHDYSISEDLFQYNFKLGLKAANNWYYSFTAQFKTQLLNNYEANSQTLKAAFLSSSDLNLGLGMTYSKVNNANTINFTASIAPLSYNLKTCINPRVDHGQFGIAPDKKTLSEIGSSAELNLKANLSQNILYTSRLFFFSDYSYFLGDWENTLSFQFNRYFSTQIYAHLRFDSSTELNGSKWRHWMLKEILSFGLTYTFSTQQ